MGLRSISTLLAIVTIALPAGGARAAEPPPAPHPRALVVSIDGLRPEHYREAEARGIRIPNIARLIAVGASADGVVGVLPTLTYPSHATLLTGVKPNQHGIVSNKIFDPYGRADGAWYWFARDIEVPTLVSAARAKGLRTAAISWPVAIGLGADFNMPEFWRGASKHPFDVRFLEQFSTPGLLDSVGAARGRPLPSFPEQRDTDRADVAAWVIENHAPELVLVHFFDFDFAQHAEGSMMPKAIASLEATDALVGRLLASLGKSGHRDDTLVAIVSDHGFVPVTTTVKPNVWLVDAGLVRLDGSGQVTQYDAYFHAEGGSASLRLRDEDDAKTLARVEQLVAAKAADPANGVERVLDRRAVAELGGVGALALDARDGFEFGMSARGGWSEPSRSKAQHGYAPLRDSIRAGLVIAGPGVGHRSLGVVAMTSVAPTIARHLRVELSPLAATPIDLSGDEPPR